ncbi:Trehalose transport system permease protein SugA [subsurface metagenome]
MFFPFSKKFRFRELNEAQLAYLIIFPSVVILLCVIFYPIIYTFYLSFHKMFLTQPGRVPFIGLKNYIRFFHSSFFWNALLRTAYFTFLSVGMELILGLGIALLLNQNLIGSKFLRVSIMIPWAIPTVVIGIMWKWIYNANYGALNGLLFSLGIIPKYQAWLAKPFIAMNFVIIADVWHMTPFVVLIFLASLAVLPKALYEAAKIDGASAWKCFKSITLPLLTPAILVVLVFRTVEAFKVFDIIYVMTRGGPANATQVINYYTYLETFSYLHFGRGSALSFIISAIVLIIALIYIKLLYKGIEYY